MIVKELRDARWNFAIGVVLFAIVSASLRPYEAVLQNGSSLGPGHFTRPINPMEQALSEIWVSYVSSIWIILTLAAIFGFSLISGEASRGSLFFLLARPASRSRMLLTKYGVGAGYLLTVVALGTLGLVIAAGLKGYPVGALSVSGLVLSTILLWLGSLFVLGLAILMSVVFRDVIASAVATPVSLALALFLPPTFAGYLIQVYGEQGAPEATGATSESLTLLFYWANESLFMGGNLAATEFIVCAVAATLPLLAALWLFNRKAY